MAENGKIEESEFKALYPFQNRLVEIDGGNYHYLDEGEGEPVVMVHGNPTWSFFYRNLVIGLRDQYRCLAPDHLGCGLSEKPPGYRYSLERHIMNLETWLEALLPDASWSGGKINLIVHDWGGPIGIGYAIRHPTRIRRVVILNTSVFTAGDMPWRIKICRWPFLGALMVRGLNLFSSMATISTTVKPLPQAVRDAYVMPYNSWENRAGIHAFVKDIPLDPDTPTGRLLAHIEDMVRGVLADKPMLIQWGMRDWCFTPFFLDLWRKRFPQAEVDKYPAGHYILEDAGGEILARIRAFLERPDT
ncbi:MAG: alpha/beta fold hydrolase [Planctomycetes bacterium]|nr:alpha/beta fold hydrolase [Planctomycetota bacterium]